MSEQLSGPGVELALAFSTWVFILHAAGVRADDAELVAHCGAVEAATTEETGDEAGMKLVRRVLELMGEGEPLPDKVVEVAGALFGERLHTDLGLGDRAERASKIRRYQYSSGLPWLARIFERKEDGVVAPTWLLVERVSDVVRAMDPNPWDDVDEERDLPWPDFQVLWELDACTSLAVS